MRYFVTGATGFIGRRVVERLRARRHEVTCLVRSPEAARALPELAGCELARGDLEDRESLRAMKGADGIFHLAAVFAFGLVGRRARAAMRANVEGTRNVLETMQTLGIERGVYTSSVIVHSDTGGEVADESFRHDGSAFRSLYEESKWRAHYEVAVPLQERGLPLVIVMPGGVYGPGETGNLGAMIRMGLRGWPLLLPREGCTMPLVHVDDVAEGHVLAMEGGEVGESYHLGGANARIGRVARIAASTAGVPVRLPLPGWIPSAALPLVRLLERVLPWPAYLSSESLRMAAGGQLAVDSGKAESELGWRWRGLEEGIAQVAAEELRRLGRQLPAGR